jgi:hypothetical protein
MTIPSSAFCAFGHPFIPQIPALAVAAAREHDVVGYLVLSSRLRQPSRQQPYHAAARILFAANRFRPLLNADYTTDRVTGFSAKSTPLPKTVGHMLDPYHPRAGKRTAAPSKPY